MANDVSLNDLRDIRRRKAAARSKLDAELAELDDLVARLERYGHNGQRRPKAKQRPTKAKAAPHRAREPELQLSTNGRPTIRLALRELVGRTPGIAVTDAIKLLSGRTVSTAPDQRKLLSTRISQLVAEQKDFRRDGDRLYLIENGRNE